MLKLYYEGCKEPLVIGRYNPVFDSANPVYSTLGKVSAGGDSFASESDGLVTTFATFSPITIDNGSGRKELISALDKLGMGNPIYFYADSGLTRKTMFGVEEVSTKLSGIYFLLFGIKGVNRTSLSKDGTSGNVQTNNTEFLPIWSYQIPYYPKTPNAQFMSFFTSSEDNDYDDEILYMTQRMIELEQDMANGTCKFASEYSPCKKLTDCAFTFPFFAYYVASNVSLNCYANRSFGNMGSHEMSNCTINTGISNMFSACTFYEIMKSYITSDGVVHRKSLLAGDKITVNNNLKVSPAIIYDPRNFVIDDGITYDYDASLNISGGSAAYVIEDNTADKLYAYDKTNQSLYINYMFVQMPFDILSISSNITTENISATNSLLDNWFGSKNSSYSNNLNITPKNVKINIASTKQHNVFANKVYRQSITVPYNSNDYGAYVSYNIFPCQLATKNFSAQCKAAGNKILNRTAKDSEGNNLTTAVNYVFYGIDYGIWNYNSQTLIGASLTKGNTTDNLNGGISMISFQNTNKTINVSSGNQLLDYYYNNTVEKWNGGNSESKNPAEHIPSDDGNSGGYTPNKPSENNGTWNPTGNKTGPDDPTTGTGTFDPTGNDEGNISPIESNRGIAGNSVTVKLSSVGMQSLANQAWTKDGFLQYIKDFSGVSRLGDSIIDVKTCYLNIPDGNAATIEAIGGFKLASPIPCYRVDDITTFSLGSLRIERYFGNYLDFSPYTECMLTLPFASNIKISPDMIMGCTISVMLSVDVITGSGLYQIYCKDHISTKLIAQQPCNVFITLPFASSEYSTSREEVQGQIMSSLLNTSLNMVGSNAVNSGINSAAAVAGISGSLMNTEAQQSNHRNINIISSGGSAGSSGVLGTKYAYIQVSRPYVSIPEGYYENIGGPSAYITTVGRCSGYMSIQNIKSSTIKATQDEYDEIIKILQSGIYI